MPNIIQGKYGNATVYAKELEPVAEAQIKRLLDSEVSKDTNVCIMPDAHAGAGCVIGTTMRIRDKVVPNLVGVDIGCGVHVVQLTDVSCDLKKLDDVIRAYIPSGFNVRNTRHEYAHRAGISMLRCRDHVDIDRAHLSIGTLGGGNHFIEVDVDEHGRHYLVIHSGSRNLGKQIAQYYQNVAISEMKAKADTKKHVIGELKAEGREAEISSVLAKMPVPVVDKELAYCEGQSFKDYIFDMDIAQTFATWNRIAIADTIIHQMKWSPQYSIETVHNYIDLNTGILRKGAVCAKANQQLIIPMNMRDGSLLCIGKGNPAWNYSAPHGAGRLMSRAEAKKTFTMDEYSQSMEGIYSTSVNTDTIDEAPMAYKPMQEIVDAIGDTVHLHRIIKPIYNYKAGGE